MTTTFEFRGVEAEKAEAMRRYNNQRYFRYITRACAVALLFYLWFPTVTMSLIAVGDWFCRTGAVIVTNRTVVFLSANLLVALVFLLSRDRRDEESSTKPDLYDQYTSSSSSTVIVPVTEEKVVDSDDLKYQTVAPLVVEVVPEKQIFNAEEVVAEKQIVPAVTAEVEEVVVVEEAEKVAVEEVVAKKLKRTYRRTKSERKKKVNRPATAFRRTESANSGIERLSSEEFRLKIEAFIMEKKRCLVKEENEVVEGQEHCSSGLELVGAAADTSYGSY